MLSIYSASQIKALDAHTIQAEPIPSVDLMERAASKCVERIVKLFNTTTTFKVFCGLGNNGGDGLAITRLLISKGYKAEAYIINYSDKYTQDFSINLMRLKELDDNAAVDVHSKENLPLFEPTDVIIDALFGIGLSKPLTGLSADCVRHINRSAKYVIAIDIPSGLFADSISDYSGAIIKAKLTLTFQYPKLSFMFPESESYVGEWEVLDIGILEAENVAQEPVTKYLTRDDIKRMLKPRAKFSHKGTFGHCLLVSGSYGKMGAAVMAAKSLLRSGAGLLTVCIPKCGYDIMQTSVPEAMALVHGDEFIDIEHLDLKNYDAIGIGPGLSTEVQAQKTIKYLLENSHKPLVLDADGLNIVSMHKDLITSIPDNSILTPHPKEFQRLTHYVSNSFERLSLQKEFSKKHNLIVVLKGAHTCITTPAGEVYFNNTGNNGLAKGGSGDVLTGIVTSFLAQGYSPLESALIAVYLHGDAADATKAEIGEMAMIPSDVIEHIPDAFKRLTSE